MVKNRPRLCQQCGREYLPFNSLQKACSIACAKELGRKADKDRQTAKARASNREARQRLKGRSDWLREAQVVCNRYIRLRDAGQPCISCGRLTGAKINAGHYLSVGYRPELRFHPLNIHAQCEQCNSHLSGNIAQYRPRLIEKIGLQAVDWLEGPHSAQKLTVEDIKAIKAHYSEQAKRLEKGENFT